VAETSQERNADYWRNKAEELRTKAESLGSAEARLSLLGMASIYDSMASRLEGKGLDDKPA
jgi:hypothetical protein